MREIALQLLPFILPLIFLPIFPHEYELPKLVIFIIITQIILVLSAPMIINNLSNLTRDRTVVVAGFFVLTTLIADLAGLDPRVSLLGSPSRHQGLVLTLCLFEYVVLLHTYSDTKINFAKKFLRPVAFSAGLLSIITLFQKFAETILHMDIPLYNGRIVATLGNPNFLGSILVIELLFILFHSKVASGRSALLQIALQTLGLLAILTTQSQSSIIGLLLGFILYVLFRIKRNALKAVLFLVLTTASATTLSTLKSDFSIWDNQLRIWPIALEKILERPLIGYGQENFQLIFPENLHYVVDSAHNIFLEVALAGGIPLLTIFLLLIFQSLRRHSPEMRVLLIVTIFIAQFNPISIAHLVLLWYMIGLTPIKT